MARQNRFSLFAQPMDRAAFVAYFLGAVIPLGALVLLAQRYLDAVGDSADTTSRLTLVSLIVSIAVLSLGAFFALRRTTRQALDRVDEDRQQLGELVRSSRTLAAAAHRHDVLRITAEHAMVVTGARTAFVLEKKGEDELTLVQSAGRQAEDIHTAHRAELDELANQTLSTRRATERALIAGAGVPEPHQLADAVAVPCGKHAVLVAAFGEPAANGRRSGTHVLSTLAGLAGAALDNVELQSAQRNFFTHVTQLLINALHGHVGYHRDHSNHVARLAVHLGRKLGFDDARLERLHFAALLHDLGMLEVDRELFAKPEAVRKHPEIGAEMLERIALWEDLAPWVRHHHEWFDGNGYPDGLAGPEIPLESRILGVAEAFESMTSTTGYKPAIDESEALARLEESAGTQFDPELVRVLAWLAKDGSLLSE